MAIKIQELAFILRAKDYLSGVLHNVSKSMQHIDQQTEHLNKTASRLGPALASLGAGAALGEFVRSSVNAAIASQSENARVMTATLSDGAKATANMAAVQQMAIATSSKLAITQDQLKESYTLARYAGLDNTTAQRAAIDSAKLSIGSSRNVAEAQAQVAETTRMVAASFGIFGDKSKDARSQIDAIADSYALLQSRSNFANPGELSSALTEALGASKAYGVSLPAQNAMLETLVNWGKFGSMSGEALDEVTSKLSATNKKMADMYRAAGGDVITELGMIKAQFAGMDKGQQETWARAHGFEMRSVQGLNMLIGNYGKLTAAYKIYSGSAAAGMNEKLFKVRSNDAADKLAIFTNNLNNLKEVLGTGLLPMLTSAAVKAAAFAGKLQGLAEAYPTIAKLTLGFVGVSAAIAAISGTLQLLGIGRTLTLAWSAATKVLTAAQWLLNAALDANPYTLAITAAVAALAVAAYEIYEHWGAVAAFFRGVWSAIKTSVSGMGSWLYSAGASLMHSLASGIASAAMAPIHAVARIAEHIKGYVVGHSPPPLGPLHDLNRVHIIETIAATMKPAPMLAAIRRVAQVAAVGIPLAMSAPAISFAGTPGAPAGGAPVINFSITVHANGGDSIALKKAVIEAVRESAHEVTRALNDHAAVRNRARF